MPSRKMTIRTVGIIGTGVIGSSWTALFLSQGLSVIVSDPAPGAEQNLEDYLNHVWPTLVDLGLSKGASLSNYSFVGPTLAGHWKEVDFVQENAPENPLLKEKLFAEMDQEIRPEVVIASSSSGIPSSKFIGKCTVNPGRVLVGHPFNPPHLMPLVEVVPNEKTDEASIEVALNFYKAMGRSPVLLHQEVPGFVVNRLQAALGNEAYSLVSRGVITAEDLDICVTASLGPRWSATGPFMSNTLGGGGGTEGFIHILEHLGPGIQIWLDDMKVNSFTWTSGELAKLGASVAEELKARDIKTVEAERDELLVGIFKLQGSISAGRK